MRELANNLKTTTGIKERPKQIKLGECYCCKPMQDSDDRVTCQGCGSAFHNSCVGNPIHKASWTCDKHKIKVKGAIWSEDAKVAYNTCPIHNHLTLLSELTRRNPDYLETFKSESAEGKAFYTTLEYATIGNYKEAQALWAKTRNVTNFHGDPIQGRSLCGRNAPAWQYQTHHRAFCSKIQCVS